MPATGTTSMSDAASNRRQQAANMKTFLFVVAVALVFALNVFFVGTCSRLAIDIESTAMRVDDAPVIVEAPKLVSPGSAKYPTVSCRELLTVNRNALQNFSDPNDSRMYSRYTATEPAFWVSLHHEHFDPTRWSSVMDRGKYYEMKLCETFVEILTASNTSSPLHVIDVGANIGWFTLLSVASALHAGKSIVVDAFEPNPRNHLRFCESMLLNQWLDHPKVAVNLYPVGVTSPENSGSTGQMDIGSSGTKTMDDATLLKYLNVTTSSFPLVSLDALGAELGWTTMTRTSILKVDVEGLELDVFRGARKLIGSGRVENIFSEGNLRRPSERRELEIMTNLMVEEGFQVHKLGGWIGPDKDLQKVTFPIRLDDVSIALYIQGVLGECAGWKSKKRAQCNLWWRRRAEQQPKKLSRVHHG